MDIDATLRRLSEHGDGAVVQSLMYAAAFAVGPGLAPPTEDQRDAWVELLGKAIKAAAAEANG